MKNDCPFCRVDPSRIIFENRFCFAVRDRAPITKLHTLIVTKRHIVDYFSLNQEENESIWKMINSLKENIIKIDPAVTAFNIGCNAGKDAGQTVFHFHFHLIPRRHLEQSKVTDAVAGDFCFSQPEKRR